MERGGVNVVYAVRLSPGDFITTIRGHNDGVTILSPRPVLGEYQWTYNQVLEDN